MKKNVNNSEMNVQETMKTAQNAIYQSLVDGKDLFRMANVNYNFMICDEIYGDYLAYLEENIMKKSK